MDDNHEMNKPVKSAGSTLLCVAAVIVGLIGAAFLVSNILLYNDTLSRYVAQGYDAATVAGQLIPGQLIPGIFEPLGIYGGITCALFGIASLDRKVLKILRAGKDSSGEGDMAEKMDAASEFIEKSE